MNEDTKLILEEIQKLRSDMNERFKAVDKRFDTIDKCLDTVDEKVSVMYEEMIHEFEAVRYEVQTVHDMLEERIGDLDTVTAQNCKDIILLKTKRA